MEPLIFVSRLYKTPELAKNGCITDELHAIVTALNAKYGYLEHLSQDCAVPLTSDAITSWLMAHECERLPNDPSVDHPEFVYWEIIEMTVVD
jgi:hypothetical protein